MFDSDNIIPIAINWGQIFVQFSIITYLLRMRVHWGITLASSAIIALLYFENPWVMLGIFFCSTIAYYLFAAKRQFIPMVLAIAMHLFLSTLIGNISRLIS